MEEDIKIIEENIDYNSLLYEYGNAELSKKLRNAIRNLVQAHKEDEAVIKEMRKEIEDRTRRDYKYCESDECNRKGCFNCIEEYFRKKVKDDIQS